MSRGRPTVHPPILHSMLVRWGAKVTTDSNGWYKVNPSLRQFLPVQTNSHEPQGLCRQDWVDLQAALDKLEDRHMAAILRAFRPSVRREQELRFPDATYDTWWRWLRTAAGQVWESMQRSKSY